MARKEQQGKSGGLTDQKLQSPGQQWPGLFCFKYFESGTQEDRKRSQYSKA
jgi:hypothetical protein